MINLNEIISNTPLTPYSDTNLKLISQFSEIRRILDVGTGEAIILPQTLTRENYQVTCIDNNPQYCGNKGNIIVLNQEINEVIIENFDLVMFRRYCSNDNALALNELFPLSTEPQNIIIELCPDSTHYNHNAQLTSGNLVKQEEPLQGISKMQSLVNNHWLAAIDIINKLSNYETQLSKYNAYAYKLPAFIIAKKKITT